MSERDTQLRERMMQCPGCWAFTMLPVTEDGCECDCGETLTVIDLRDSSALARLEAVERERDTMREALEAVGRELERARDVRANRTKVIGNAYLIVQRALSAAAPPSEETAQQRHDEFKRKNAEWRAKVEEALAPLDELARGVPPNEETRE